jgi:hypothetical protein
MRFAVHGPPLALLAWAGAVAAFGPSAVITIVFLTLTAVALWFHGRSYEQSR